MEPALGAASINPIADLGAFLMVMEFEKAIEDASTLFLFDRRSQQLLQEMADEAPPRSRDRFLILLTQAAFAYYNTADMKNVDMTRTIAHALKILREVKRFREDRVFFTLALRLEVDLLLHQSMLAYREAISTERAKMIFNEEDERALSITETLLKNFPPTFDPFPNQWYSGVIPLFPVYREEVMEFYQDRSKEHRVGPLQKLLTKLRREMVLLNGLLQAKKFIAGNNVTIRALDKVNHYLHANVPALARFIDQAMPGILHQASDITNPRGITISELELAIDNVEAQIDNAKGDKDIRRFTVNLLQLGILNFLLGNPESTINALVRTLKASSRISAEDKKIRQYRHEEFSDIPFMIGTSYMRSLASKTVVYQHEMPMLENAITAFSQALRLQPTYHQAVINLMTAFRLNNDKDQEDALIRFYLEHFDRDISRLSNQLFHNLAFMENETHHGNLVPATVKWLLLAEFCTGGDLTKAKKMLQELKTLYILNAHEFSVRYLETYRSHFRMKDEEFINDLEDSNLHSALLFFIAHGFASLSLTQGRNNGEVSIDYANLEQSIELNGEALYFNKNNSSALRLVETQGQILQYGLQHTMKRWDSIKQNMGQRFQFYEDYLRQEKGILALRGQLENLQLEDKLPPLKLPDSMINKMNSVITPEQQDRLRNRVGAF